MICTCLHRQRNHLARALTFPLSFAAGEFRQEPSNARNEFYESESDVDKDDESVSPKPRGLLLEHGAVQCLDPNELDGSLIGIKQILVEGCKTLCSFEESHLKKLSRTPVRSNSLSRSRAPLFYA